LAKAFNKQTKLTVKVPSFLPAEAKSDIAQRVIDYIVERTQAGNNPNNNRWARKAGKYTKAYAKEKGQRSPVDLEESGAMLRAIKYFKGKSKGENLTIGYTANSRQEKKARGNITGEYGQPKPISGKARPFLDILKKDLDTIIDDYIEEVADGEEDS